MKLGKDSLGVETTAGKVVAVGDPGVTWLLMERADGSRYMAAADSRLIEEAKPVD